MHGGGHNLNLEIKAIGKGKRIKMKWPLKFCLRVKAVSSVPKWHTQSLSWLPDLEMALFLFYFFFAARCEMAIILMLAANTRTLYCLHNSHWYGIQGSFLAQFISFLLTNVFFVCAFSTNGFDESFKAFDATSFSFQIVNICFEWFGNKSPWNSVNY